VPTFSDQPRKISWHASAWVNRELAYSQHTFSTLPLTRFRPRARVKRQGHTHPANFFESRQLYLELGIFVPARNQDFVVRAKVWLRVLQK
jgi:hypothetical protein